MKRFVLSLVSVALVSCGLSEISHRPQKGDVWMRPGMNLDSIAIGKSVAYVTVMEYLAGYDWIKDKEKGSVKCSLAVYVGGSPIMKIPVGDEYEVSSDPDSHRIIAGHLYTNYSSEDETVIKKDGKAIIRYEGREVISDLVVHDGDVYTLGHNLDGSGFSYRKNGGIILERERGKSFGEIHKVGDSLFVAFREPVSSLEGVYERYYYMGFDKIVQTAIRQDIVKVWDIAPYKGGVCYLATLVGIPFPVLFTRNVMQALRIPQSSELVGCRILCGDEALYVEGLVDMVRQGISSCIWTSDGEIDYWAGGRTFSSLCMEGDGVHCTLNPSSPDGRGEIFRSGEPFDMPPDYYSAGGRTTAVVNGILHVGLSSQSGGPPLIWRDGEVTSIEVNGFITGISTAGN